MYILQRTGAKILTEGTTLVFMATRTAIGDVANGEAGRLVGVVRVKSHRYVPSATDERKRRVKMAAHPVHM